MKATKRLRLACEQLEDRTVPSLFTVTNLGDSDAGSLRQAILDANSPAHPGADSIDFAPGLVGTIPLISGQLTITDDLTINGPGADVIKVSGTLASRVFEIASPVTASISGLTIADGDSGGIYYINGGGIYNAGTLTVSGCTLSGNFGDEGGGLFNSGTATVTASTFSGNYAEWSGSALYNTGTLTLSNSTVSGNSGGFGAIGGEGPSSLTIITNSTISGTTGGSGGIWTAWSNGYAPLQARNSIIEQIFGNLDSLGHNLIGYISGTGLDPSDLLNVNPLLGPLQDNGGPTWTMALFPGSPALDAGDNADAPPFDQRGLARIVDGNGDGTATIDIGAYEVQTVLPGNTPPVAVNDSYSTNEDTALTVPAPGVLGNDTDADGNLLTAVLVSGPAHGTLTWNSNGSFTYRPNANYNGPDSFTYTGYDGAADSNSNLATVSITVIAVNDTPVNYVPQGTQTMRKNGNLTFSSGKGSFSFWQNAISIADVDAGSALIRVTLTVDYGTLTLNGTTGLHFIVGDGHADSAMTFTGTIEDINAALDGLRFTPPKNFAGYATLTITTNDLGNSGIGGPLIDTDTVAIAVGVPPSAGRAMQGAFPATVRADDGVPLKGRADLTLTSIAVEPDGTVVLTYDGTGNATQLGLFTAEASIYPHGDGTYSGTVAFTAANGDQVFFSVEAAFTSPTTTVGSATITGGTGRFLNATGGADYEEVFSDATHAQVHLIFKETIEF